MILWTVVGLAALLAALLLWSRLKSRAFERAFPPRGKFVETALGRLHLTRRDPADAATLQQAQRPSRSMVQSHGTQPPFETRRAGAPQGEGCRSGAPVATVVLIHGASGNNADMMTPLGDRLAARGLRVFAVDRPGHGYSDRLREHSSSPAAQARAIRAALEVEGVARAIVVGHSWAGSVAIAFALDHADFTQGIVLLAPVTHPWPRGVRWYYRLASKPVAGWLFAHVLLVPAGLATLRAALAGVFAPQPVPQGYAEATGALLALRPKVFRANAEDVADLRGHLEKHAPRIPSIAVPVAILSGDRDAVVLTERHSYGCAREIAGASLEILPGVGHSPHWAAPDRTAETIAALAARAKISPRSSANAQTRQS